MLRRPARRAPEDQFMSDYELYYWPVPFRGQFIRAILAYADKRWDEYDSESIFALMEAAPDRQPVAPT